MRETKILCDECGKECSNPWYGLSENQRLRITEGADKDFCTPECRGEWLSNRGRLADPSGQQEDGKCK